VTGLLGGGSGVVGAKGLVFPVVDDGGVGLGSGRRACLLGFSFVSSFKEKEDDAQYPQKFKSLSTFSKSFPVHLYGFAQGNEPHAWWGSRLVSPTRGGVPHVSWTRFIMG